MFVQCMKDYCLAHALSTLFAILMKWLSLVASTVVYKKMVEIITFQMESQNSKHLTRKQFTKILRLPLKGQFETPTTDQILEMFNEMGYQTPITLVNSFKKENLPSIWNFFFRIKLQCLTGQSTSMDKSKLQFYSVVAGLYYNMQVDYALLLWVEFLLQFLTLR